MERFSKAYNAIKKKKQDKKNQNEKIKNMNRFYGRHKSFKT
jgi:hypothetical protein